jgi:hypothetical protein
MIDLDRLIELEANATPGPWIESISGKWCCAEGPDVATFEEGERDAQLIAAMRNSIKELCSELKAAREVCDSAKKFIDRYIDAFGLHEDSMRGELINNFMSSLDKLDEARRG